VASSRRRSRGSARWARTCELLKVSNYQSLKVELLTRVRTEAELSKV